MNFGIPTPEMTGFDADRHTLGRMVGLVVLLNQNLGDFGVGSGCGFKEAIPSGNHGELEKPQNFHGQIMANPL